jgi:methylthioribose-1-phosphate isomerase
MDVVNMALRLNQKDINAQDLMQAMLISVQKEYEHNSAQQIYVSETLWQVLSQARTGTVNLIRAAYENCKTEATSQDFLRQLQNKMQEVKLNPADQAKLALRSEAATVLNL